jgi:hypothetical protein
MPHVRRGPDSLLRRRLEVRDLDAERGQGLANLHHRGNARSCSEDDSHERTDSKAERKRSEPRSRPSGAEDYRPQRRQGDEPARQHANPTNEFRPDDHEHRHRTGQPHLGVAPAR